MNNNKIKAKHTKLGKALCRVVGTRKAIKLLLSLQCSGDKLALNINASSLANAFMWRHSPQGHDYWNKLHKQSMKIFYGINVCSMEMGSMSKRSSLYYLVSSKGML